jgi:hypothetical protein
MAQRRSAPLTAWVEGNYLEARALCSARRGQGAAQGQRWANLLERLTQVGERYVAKNE